MKTASKTITLALLGTFAATAFVPVLADPSSQQKNKNQWRNLSILGAAVAGYGLLKHDKTATAVGAAGGAYSASRYEKDRQHQSQDNANRRRYYYGGYDNNGNYNNNNNGNNNGGYYDGNGNFHSTGNNNSGNGGGYYDNNGNFHNYDNNGGYNNGGYNNGGYNNGNGDYQSFARQHGHGKHNGRAKKHEDKHEDKHGDNENGGGERD